LEDPRHVERYNIVDETDLANAADRRDHYLDRELHAGRKVVSLSERQRA